MQERTKERLRYIFALTCESLFWAFCAGVFLFSLQRKGIFDYDESNTLRIAAQNVHDIFSILKYEQNFPLYYLFLHILGPSNALLIKVVNAAFWLLNVLVARKILSFFVQDRLRLAVATLIFAAAPYLFLYAYYCRMYGLTNLILTVQAYLLIKDHKAGRNTHRPARFALSLLLVALHPLGIVAAIAVTFMEYRLLERENPGWTVFTSFTSLGCLLLQLLPKARSLWDIYHGSGVRYVADLGMGLSAGGLLYFTHSVFYYVSDMSVHILFLSVVIIACVQSIKAKSYKDAKFLILFVLASAFVLLPVLLPSGVHHRHAAFFLAPFLILMTILVERAFLSGGITLFLAIGSALLIGGSTWAHPWRLVVPASGTRPALFIIIAATVLLGWAVNKLCRQGIVFPRKIVFFVLAGCMVITYLLGAYNTVLARYYNDRFYNRVCGTLNTFKDNGDVYVTDYLAYNIVDECAGNRSSSHVVVAGADEVFDTTGLATSDILRHQASKGGQVSMDANTRNYLVSSPEIKGLLGKYKPEKMVFYFTIFACDWGKPIAYAALPGYRLDRSVLPEITVYQRKGLK